MASRLDRLIQLLDTGASPAIRQAAAKQVAQIATKCLRTDSGIEGDINVKPDPSGATSTSQERLEDWSEVISVAAKILPLLRSKNTETRNAAAATISHICSLAPLWTPVNPPGNYDHEPTEFPPFSVEQLLESGNLLLSSSGQEFSKPMTFGTPAELERARKEAKSRLGLDFLDAGDDEDNGWTQELMEEATDVRMNENHHEQVVSPDSKMDVASPGTDEIGSPMSTDAPIHFARPAPPRFQSQQNTAIDHADGAKAEDDSALSAREKNRLKRKRRHQAGHGAYISPAAAAPPSKIRVVEQEGRPIPKRQSSSPPPDEENKIVVDPQAGGQVDAKEKAQHKALEAKSGQWIWAGLTKVLSVDLFNPNWEVRHGTCMALREIIKIQGASAGMHYHSSAEENAIHHEKWCNDMAAKLLCVFVLDRFGDFVADQVIAPVRESATQALAALLTHTPIACVKHVHNNLLDMIRQEFPKKENGRTKVAYVWQVRHAGLLGLKYEVAVREDLIEKDENRSVLRGVVEAAILGLGDNDDDVRSVAAGCLLPIAKQIVDYLTDDIPQLLNSLWSCFDSMKDDLGSSVGAVMDLLGSLVAFPRVLEVIGDKDRSRSLDQLAPLLFPFFRHTISSVRLAVVRTLHDFILVKDLPMGWITTSFLRLLFQNILLEEREDVRSLSLKTWNLALRRAITDANSIHELIPIAVFRDWIETCTTPIGDAIDPARLFILNYQDELAEAHNVDKIMMNQDLSLIEEGTIWLARIACAQTLAVFANILPREAQQEYFEIPLKHYLNSPSYFHKFMGATILREWAVGYESSTGDRLVSHSNLAEDLSKILLAAISADPPNCYHESFPLLDHMCKITFLQLNSFLVDPRFSGTTIQLPQQASIGGGPEFFGISHVRQAVDWLDNLHNLLPKPKKKRDGNRIDESKRILRELLHSFEKTKTIEDARVAAAFAAAAIALKTMPSKLTPLIKGVMNGLREEENTDLQDRSAVALASFIHFGVLDSSATFQGPVDKVIKNLCVFLCQDDTHTPLFSKFTSKESGILSFNKAVASAVSRAPMRLRDEPPDEPRDVVVARVMRRGGTAAFSRLATQFGPALFDRVPKVWQCVSESLSTAYPSGSTVEAGDRTLETDAGQSFLDTLTALRDILPTLDPALFPRVEGLFPSLVLGLQSRFAVIRQAVAKCFAVICNVMTNSAMLYIIEHVLPLVDDAKVVKNRQGGVEVVFHVVNTLQFKTLPYIIFLIVPLLGRMSDPDEDVRSAATNSFATLVKMVPLEAGLPDPPGFPEELLNKRDKERVFLSQLFDGSKVENYTIPVQINAELRKYQQDGVNWLAFLSKYQLHGILCDDMGLGKTLQSICILASRHYERAQRKESHLPSFIICPPTLTSHWYHEIKKYAPSLRPVTYTGPIKDRKITLKRIPQYDVVITSYDVVRNDFSQLSGLNWLYCILDEGHLIKNAKSKVSVAVKNIKAHHRLILSGTPIQNNLLELWSLFDFLMPGFLGNETSFNERFARPVLASKDGKAGAKGAEAAAQALEALHKQVLPFLLRRMKENVLNDLPPKIIQDYYCDVSPLQQQLFDEFQNSKASTEAETAVKGGNSKGHVFQALQYLRKICNHPALVLKADQPETATLLSKLEEQSNGSKSVRDVQHAPKLLALKQLLHDCGIGVTGKDPEAAEDPLVDVETAPPQHRCLIFCQMKMMIDVIETDLFQQLMPSVTYMRLDGTIDAQKRHAIVQTFNDDPSIDCLLLTTHIGGLGLTLTGADTVIFVEHDWNPMKDLQAMDRAHRLGQKRVVNVYRLITKGTLEEKIMGLQRFKLNIANSVVTQQNAGLDSMDTDLVLDLFKRTTDEEDAAAAAKKASQTTNGSVSQKNILEGLEELHGEEEYAGLDLQSFMSSLGR